MRIHVPLAAAAFLIAGPALAAATPEPAVVPQSAAAQTSAPADTTQPAPAPAEAAKPASVADTVTADWGKYDAGNKGSLTKVEFGKWMTDLRTAAGQPAPDAAWLKTAFTQTDTDKNAKVSAAELTAFLSAGA